MGIGHIASQYPNKQAVYLREDREIENGLEEEKDTMPHLKANNYVEYSMDLKILITRHVLTMQIKEKKEQRKNIFYTGCHVNDEVCGIIINGESVLTLLAHVLLKN